MNLKERVARLLGRAPATPSLLGADQARAAAARQAASSEPHPDGGEYGGLRQRMEAKYDAQRNGGPSEPGPKA